MKITKQLIDQFYFNTNWLRILPIGPQSFTHNNDTEITWIFAGFKLAFSQGYLEATCVIGVC